MIIFIRILLTSLYPSIPLCLEYIPSIPPPRTGANNAVLVLSANVKLRPYKIMPIFIFSGSAPL